MRLLVCSKSDLVANLILNRLLPRLRDHEITLLLANRHRPEVGDVAELELLRDLEEQLANRLLFPLLDAQAPSPPEAPSSTADSPEADTEAGDDERLFGFAELAQRTGTRLISAQGASSADRSALYRDARPEAIVAVKYGYLFSADDLRLPRLGALNLHSGLLPARPGLHATLWAMLEGDREGGCCLHWMDAQIDSGPLVAQRAVPLNYNRSFFANMLAVYLAGAELIAEALETLAAGRALPTTPQTGPRGICRSLPGPGDMARLKERGPRMIDAEDIIELLMRYRMPRPADIPRRHR